MSLSIRLRHAAQAEYDESTDWYESRQAGLGSKFVAAIEKAMADISHQPERWPEVWPGIRERPVRKWPFCIYYQIRQDHIQVLAVFHTARDPAIWQSRAP